MSSKYHGNSGTTLQQSVLGIRTIGLQNPIKGRDEVCLKSLERITYWSQLLSL